MAYNASSTVSALKVVLEKMIDLSEDLEEKDRWTKMLSRIPPLSLTTRNGKNDCPGEIVGKDKQRRITTAVSGFPGAFIV